MSGRLFQLNPEQQRAALAHEMARVFLRCDPEWLIATDLITRVFFFQPLYRLARARLRDSAKNPLRPVGGAADAITAGAGALPLRSGRVVRGRSGAGRCERHGAQ